ncbi:MAG: hypothetical protein VX246_13140 [Myxococcota bacterium]|nr:hypothetical protein [Myxococcota bacterium]
MEPIPARIEEAIAAGVQTGPSCPFSEARGLATPGDDGAGDTVVRQADGTLFVACRTEMPGVTPAMWDWWFGWHSYTSERYQLWHPKEHLWSALRDDRLHLTNDRERYIGNISYVDEFIGPKFQRLSIAFVAPAAFGFDPSAVNAIGTAICARTSLRRERADAGRLIHLVRKTATGSEMLSRFWIGEIDSRIPGLRIPLNALLNRPAVRRHLLPDVDGLHLLRHCSDEMNHLARILPALYERFGTIHP